MLSAVDVALPFCAQLPTALLGHSVSNTTPEARRSGPGAAAFPPAAQSSSRGASSASHGVGRSGRNIVFLLLKEKFGKPRSQSISEA